MTLVINFRMFSNYSFIVVLSCNLGATPFCQLAISWWALKMSVVVVIPKLPFIFILWERVNYQKVYHYKVNLPKVIRFLMFMLCSGWLFDDFMYKLFGRSLYWRTFRRLPISPEYLHFETSVDRNYKQYLNTVHFINSIKIKHPWKPKRVISMHRCSFIAYKWASY